MKLDWQHVVLMVACIAGVSTVIVLGHGNTLIQVLAALGGAGTLGALLKSSPLDPRPGTVTVTPPVLEFPAEEPTRKEGLHVRERDGDRAPNDALSGGSPSDAPPRS